jgi:hypothetical protein
MARLCAWTAAWCARVFDDSKPTLDFPPPLKQFAFSEFKNLTKQNYGI